MELDFTKMHGAGNDFIFIDDLSSDVELSAEQVRWLCDRNFGIGADGVILVQPPQNADSVAYMGYFNNDGSVAEMCGNGIRCFAKYLVDKGFVAAGDRRFVADTLAGRRQISFEVDDSGLMAQASVDMGQPIFAPKLIPTTLVPTTQFAMGLADAAESGSAQAGTGGQGQAAAAEPAVVDVALPTAIGELRFTCVSMGNPHAVAFFDAASGTAQGGSTPSAIAHLDISVPGSQLEVSAIFPQKANIEFAEVLDPGSSDSPAEINLRVWERGVGETLACGTGTCATVVAAVLSGRILSRNALVHLPGGDLLIEWQDNNHVIMTGPAATVFEGTIEL